jgi:hypothetical protein
MQIHADGTADAKCATCAPKQIWWCNGNILTLNNYGASFTRKMTLSADGNELQGSWGTAVRDGKDSR